MTLQGAIERLAATFGKPEKWASRTLMGWRRDLESFPLEKVEAVLEELGRKRKTAPALADVLDMLVPKPKSESVDRKGSPAADGCLACDFSGRRMVFVHREGTAGPTVTSYAAACGCALGNRYRGAFGSCTEVVATFKAEQGVTAVYFQTVEYPELDREQRIGSGGVAAMEHRQRAAADEDRTKFQAPKRLARTVRNEPVVAAPPATPTPTPMPTPTRTPPPVAPAPEDDWGGPPPWLEDNEPQEWQP